MSDRTKKILLVCSDSLSQPVTRNRMLPFINVLQARGFVCDLVCPQDAANSEHLPAGANLIEIRLNAERQSNYVLRTLRELRNAASLLKAARSAEADVFLVSIPSIFLAFMAPVYLRRKVSYLDIRDLTWEYLDSTKIIQALSKRIFRVAFRLSINKYQGVCVTNPTELQYLQSVWKGEKEPLLVSNGISREQFERLSGLSAKREKRLTVSYIGNVGLAQHLDTLLAAAQALPEMDFKVIGAGTDFVRIKSLAAEMQLENLVFTGRVPWQDVRQHYNQSDILYAQLAPEYAGAMPSKLYEYLATGKFVLYSGQAQAAEILAGFEHNKVIPPCDANALIAALRGLQGEAAVGKLSLANRNKIEQKYIREDAAEKLASAIYSLNGNV